MDERQGKIQMCRLFYFKGTAVQGLLEWVALYLTDICLWVMELKGEGGGGRVVLLGGNDFLRVVVGDSSWFLSGVVALVAARRRPRWRCIRAPEVKNEPKMLQLKFLEQLTALYNVRNFAF